MHLEFRDGLLFVRMEITYKGKAKQIDSIAIDTGASHSIISPDAVQELGLTLQRGDLVVKSRGIGGSQYAFTKLIDRISFGPFDIRNCTMDIGPIDPEGRINGLLGLDLLMKAGAIMDPFSPANRSLNCCWINLSVPKQNPLPPDKQKQTFPEQEGKQNSQGFVEAVSQVNRTMEIYRTSCALSWTKKAKKSW